MSGQPLESIHCCGEYIPVIRDTGQRIVPRHEGSEDAKVAPSLDDHGLGSAILAVQVADGEQQEGEIEEEEEQEEGDGGTQRTEQQDTREDKPAGEEEAEGIGEVVRAGRRPGVCRLDLEAARREQDREGEPEAAIGGERRGTKSVPYCHLPTQLISVCYRSLIKVSRRTTCQRAAGRARRTRRPMPPRC